MRSTRVYWKFKIYYLTSNVFFRRKHSAHAPIREMVPKAARTHKTITLSAENKTKKKLFIFWLLSVILIKIALVNERHFLEQFFVTYWLRSN